MNTLWTLAGFALVFIVGVWALSALATLALGATGRWVRRVGPAAERRVTTMALGVPVVLGLALVAALVVRSLVAHDHCQAHDHHAHLCLTHGAEWGQRPLAMAFVAATVAVASLRLLLLLTATLGARRRLARLRRQATRQGDVWLVPSPKAFCFVAGVVRPQIYVSTAAWNGLDDEERAAMLAHERGHVRHRDVAWRVMLEAFAAFTAPLVPSTLMARWELATERLRDVEAAAEIRNPTTVASAMVHLCRLGAAAPGGRCASFTPAHDALGARVAALLDGAERGDRAARTAGWLGVALVVAVVVAIGLQSEPLHHLLESLLG